MGVDQGTGLKMHQNAGFRICNFKIFSGMTPPDPRCGRGGNPVAMTHTRPRACTSVPPQFLGPSAAHETETSIFSVWARHTNAARPTLAAVSGTHRFQVSCAHLPMPAWPCATVSFWLHPGRRRFQLSSSSSQLVIRRTRLSTVGDRAFPVAGCRLWNSLPPDVTSASTLSVFRSRLKTYLFSQSFPSCFRF